MNGESVNPSQREAAVSTAEIEACLQELAVRTAYKSGQEFFDELARTLADIFDISTVVVAECLDRSATKIRTISFLHKSELLKNLVYPVESTPCGAVYYSSQAFFPKGVRALFPDDKELEELGIESYAGLEVNDSSGEPVGHLCLMDVDEMPQRVWDLQAFRAIRMRCGTEIERQKSEEKKNRLKQTYESIINCSTDGMYLKTIAGEFSYANSSCIELLDLNAKTNGYFASDNPTVSDAMHKSDGYLKANREPFTEIVRVEYQDRRRRSIQITQSPVFGEDQSIVNIVGVARDITELIETRETLENNLRLASMGTIAAGIAHEINNPLTAIQLSTELAMLSSGDNDTTQRQLAIIQDSVQSASQIVDEVLRASKNQISNQTSCDLTEILFKAIDQTRDLSEKFAVTINVDAVERAMAKVNSIELRQVLVNLICNAIQASSANYASQIDINLHILKNDIVISIRDFGTGIRESDQAHIFEPFFTTRVDQGGTGLGLSVSKRIVDNHHGQISFQSVDPGVKFVVSLKRDC